MPALPPPEQVIEWVIPNSFNADWIAQGLTIVREKDEAGVDYRLRKNVMVGGRYGDTAKTNAGEVHDQRVTIKITVRF